MSLRYSIKEKGDTKTYIYFRPSQSNDLDDIQLILQYGDKYDVYPDADADDSYTMIKDYIGRLVNKSGFLCKGLNPDYILESFDNANAIVIVGSSMNVLPNGNIFGFASINFDEKHNSIYIDVICSHVGIKGAGDFLMKEIESICRKLSMTEIYLKSVKSAIPFYKKYGFVKYNSHDKMSLMIKSVRNKYSGNSHQKTNKQKKSKKSKKTRKKR